MKLTREDFKLIQCEDPEDDYEYLISKRFFLFNLIPTSKFNILLNDHGDAPIDYFKSEKLAEEYINTLINKIKNGKSSNRQSPAIGRRSSNQN